VRSQDIIYIIVPLIVISNLNLNAGCEEQYFLYQCTLIYQNINLNHESHGKKNYPLDFNYRLSIYIYKIKIIKITFKVTSE
jgi:hypothetical protein